VGADLVSEAGFADEVWDGCGEPDQVAGAQRVGDHGQQQAGPGVGEDDGFVGGAVELVGGDAGIVLGEQVGLVDREVHGERTVSAPARALVNSAQPAVDCPVPCSNTKSMPRASQTGTGAVPSFAVGLGHGRRA
jgi:hypothetical protein